MTKNDQNMPELTHTVEAESIASATSSEPYVPRIYLEISKEQLDILEVGKDVTIEVSGKVKGLSADQKDKSGDKYEIQLALTEVKISPEDNSMAKLLDKGE